LASAEAATEIAFQADCYIETVDQPDAVPRIGAGRSGIFANCSTDQAILTHEIMAVTANIAHANDLGARKMETCRLFTHWRTASGRPAGLLN
jgi:hypothetical protein